MNHDESTDNATTRQRPAARLAPPRVPPSSVRRFLQTVENESSIFPCTDFAGYLRLTAAEAQAVLNDYADQGLLTLTGLQDGVEQWQVSREGLDVFGGRWRSARRWKKDEVAAARAALGEAFHRVGGSVVELSMGGKPAFGHPNGTLIVGVRVADAPYSRADHDTVANEVFTAVSRACGHPNLTLLMFDDLVPQRLRHRFVFRGDGSEVVAIETPDTGLDFDELRQREVLQRLANDNNITTPEDFGLSMYRRTVGALDPGLSYRLMLELVAISVPLSCKRSCTALPHDSEALAATVEAQLQYEIDEIGRAAWQRDRATERSVAEADYHLAVGGWDGLRRYCATLDVTTAPHKYWWLNSLGCSARDVDDLERLLLAALCMRRDELADERVRQQRLRAEKMPVQPAYYALFDCLNFRKPKLAGFVRLTPYTDTGLRELQRWWGDALRNSKLDTIGARMKETGWSAGWLSLWIRPATDEERQGYEAVSKAAGATLQFIMFTGTAWHAKRARDRFTLEQLSSVPAVLQGAKYAQPVLPKLLSGASYGDRRPGHGLFAVLDALPEPMRTHASARVMDIDRVSMSAFATLAAEQPARDPLVLAAAIGDQWHFTAAGEDWAASIAANDWSVSLAYRGRTLVAKIQIDGAERRQQLAPVKPDFLYGAAYTNTLDSLLPFMRRMRRVHERGLAGCEFDDDRPEGPAARLAWFLNIVSELLNGYHWRDEFGDHSPMRWPTLEVDTKGGGAELGLSTCIACGCGDRHPCTTGCWWIRVNRAKGTGVCSNCRHAVDEWDAARQLHSPA